MAKTDKPETPSKSTLYGQAIRELRTRHAQEFDEIVSGIYAEHGLMYIRRLTAEEKAERARVEEETKAEAQLQRLLDRHPILASRVSQTELPQ